MVDASPAIKDGTMIDDADELPAFVIIPIIDVGSNCKLVQERMMSIVIGYVTFPDLLSSFMLSIALIPIGVAAPPMPSMFAEIFIETYCFALGDKFFLPNIKSMIGDRIFVSNFEIPVNSNILKIPTHTA